MNDLLYYNRRVHLIQNVSEKEPIPAMNAPQNGRFTKNNK
jgi:hypothetical protein